MNAAASASRVPEIFAPEPFFHDCPADPDCPHCAQTGVSADSPDWSFLDAVYCISLRERDDRAREVAAQFHRVGLCRLVRFFRPERHETDPVYGIWESHRTVARQALAEGHSTVLILEDDVQFSRTIRSGRIRAIAEAHRRLPSDWWIFYLGHWPIRARFLRRNVIRTTSACTHAYIAGPPLLRWLSDSEPEHVRLYTRFASFVGRGLDAAFCELPGSYAYFPMIAIQSTSPSDHVRADERDKIRRAKHLISRTRLREYLLSKLMRPNEFLVLAIAPVHAVLDRFSRAGRSGR